MCPKSIYICITYHTHLYPTYYNAHFNSNSFYCFCYTFYFRRSWILIDKAKKEKLTVVQSKSRSPFPQKDIHQCPADTQMALLHNLLSAENSLFLWVFFRNTSFKRNAWIVNVMLVAQILWKLGKKLWGTWCLVQIWASRCFWNTFQQQRYILNIDGCSSQLMMSYFDREQTKVVHIEKDNHRYYWFLGKTRIDPVHPGRWRSNFFGIRRHFRGPLMDNQLIMMIYLGGWRAFFVYV